MIYDDNGELAYLLNHNRIGVTIDALDTLVEIHPNEEYWQDKLGVSPIELDQFKGMPKDIYEKLERLLTKYYVPKEVYASFSANLILAEIDDKYLDDLLLVTHYYGSYRHDLRGDGKKHQEAVSHMLGFVEELNNGLFEVDRLTIRGKRIKSLNPLKYELDQKFVINEPNVLRNLIQEFKGWLNNSPRYRQMFTDHSELEGLSSAAKDRLVLDQLYQWLYEFLIDHKLAENHRDACTKMGLLMSIYRELVPAFEHTGIEQLDEVKALRAYKREVGNYVRNRMERVLDRRLGSKKFQTRKK